MHIEKFLDHHGLTCNPFDAEEARHDPIFERLIDGAAAHPDFAKILGRLDQPSTAVVFGEKGSGKTAIRMTIAKRIEDWNKENPDKKTLVISYDDLNPVLDRLANRYRQQFGFKRAAKRDPLELLESLRLVDHQDAILSLAVTSLMDHFAADDGDSPKHPIIELKDAALTELNKLSRQKKVDLGILAALYDMPTSGTIERRWDNLTKRLKLNMFPKWPYLRNGSIAMTAATIILIIVSKFSSLDSSWAYVTGLAAVGLWGYWAYKYFVMRSLSGHIRDDMRVLERTRQDLQTMLGDLPSKDTRTHNWPMQDNADSRFQLTRKYMGILEELGYSQLMILVDRIDEPTMVQGDAQRMRAVVWPMFSNKFLQQENVAFKLLLPIELRHELHKESADFFQEARMDKQSMIDRLSWTGSTLYDLANTRLKACLTEDKKDTEPVLTDLFAEEVNREIVVEALEQMRQPRDAFKFLYQIIQEHCNNVSNDESVFKIPRMTLETAKKQQAQRVQDLSRGLAPA